MRQDEVRSEAAIGAGTDAQHHVHARAPRSDRGGEAATPDAAPRRRTPSEPAADRDADHDDDGDDPFPDHVDDTDDVHDADDADDPDDADEVDESPRPRFVTPRSADSLAVRRRHLGRPAFAAPIAGEPLAAPTSSPSQPGTPAPVASSVGSKPESAAPTSQIAETTQASQTAPAGETSQASSSPAAPAPQVAGPIPSPAAEAPPRAAAASPVGVVTTTHGGPGGVTDLGRRAEAPTERMTPPPPRARAAVPHAVASPPMGVAAHGIQARVSIRDGQGARRTEPARPLAATGGVAASPLAAWRASVAKLRGAVGKEVLMGNGAKIGLVGVLALIVLVVALWDKSSEEAVNARTLEPYSGAAPDAGQLTARSGPAGGSSSETQATRFQIDTGTQRRPGAGSVPAPEGAAGSFGGASGGAGASATAAGTEPPPAVIGIAAPAPATGTARPQPAAGAPSSSGERTHVVAPGETFASISKKYFQTTRHYTRIVEANRDRVPNPNLLPIGVTLRIPEIRDAPATGASGGSGAGAGAGGVATSGQPGPGSAPPPVGARAPAPIAAPPVAVPPGGRTHVVQRGDTLYQIAARYLGSGSKHPLIFEANRERIPDPSRLPVGATLVIPPPR